MKIFIQLIGASTILVLLAGCGEAAATPTPTNSPPQALLPPPQTHLPPPTPLPSPLPARPTEKPDLFEYLRTVPVTPAGNFEKASFTRIGYVPGRDAMVVTFDTMLAKPEGTCSNKGYGYREYNLDMVETGDQGLINCYGGAMDTGGLFVGDDFYFAFQSGGSGGSEGWMLAKYSAVTWQPSVPLTFFPLPKWRDPGDPMIAVVNGQIDISSKINTDPDAPGDCPYVDCRTHHQLFTTDLQFIEERDLADAIHVNLTSLVQTGDGTIHFLTGDSLMGDMMVLKYDKDWTHLETKVIMEKAGAPEGAAFDGERFYVSYLDVSVPDVSNVHLAAFDKEWNLLDDITLTTFASQEYTTAARPSMTLHNGRIYVCYDQAEHTDIKYPSTEQNDVQVYVAVVDVNPNAGTSH
jgi:hypothetical protein